MSHFYTGCSGPPDCEWCVAKEAEDRLEEEIPDWYDDLLELQPEGAAT